MSDSVVSQISNLSDRELLQAIAKNQEQLMAMIGSLEAELSDLRQKQPSRSQRVVETALIGYLLKKT